MKNKVRVFIKSLNSMVGVTIVYGIIALLGFVVTKDFEVLFGFANILLAVLLVINAINQNKIQVNNIKLQMFNNRFEVFKSIYDIERMLNTTIIDSPFKDKTTLQKFNTELRQNYVRFKDNKLIAEVIFDNIEIARAMGKVDIFIYNAMMYSEKIETNFDNKEYRLNFSEWKEIAQQVSLSVFDTGARDMIGKYIDIRLIDKN